MGVYQYDAQNDRLNRISGGTLYASIPIGSYIPFGGTAIPTGWLLCNGQAVSRTDYADLFAVIGTAYGSGDGSTTFNIPDLREAVPKGAGLTSKSNNHMDADGLAVGEFLDDRIQNHAHGSGGNNPRDGSYITASDSSRGNIMSSSSVSNARTGATTEVKSVGSNYIIKAKQIGVPADFASAIVNVISDKLSFSKTEVNTGRKWINGKDIYRKVLEIPFTVGTMVTSTVSGVTMSDFQVIDMGHSYIYNSTYGTRQPWACNYNGDVEVFYISEGTLRFKTTHPDGTLYAVVEYTKSS